MWRCGGTVLRTMETQSSFSLLLFFFFFNYFCSLWHSDVWFNQTCSFSYGYFQTVNVLYTLLIAALLEPFFCIAQVDGTYTMSANPSVQCYSDTWKHKVLSYFVPLGCLYGLVFPVRVFVVLYFNRKTIDSARFENFFGFLTNSCRREMYWYELEVILNKVVFMLVPEFLALKFSLSLKLFSSTIILVAFHMNLQHFKPYNQEILNKLSLQ